MSVKDETAVARYVTQVTEIQTALAQLHRWASSLPIPTSGVEIPNLHYGHLGTVGRIRERLGEVVQSADQMFERG